MKAAFHLFIRWAGSATQKISSPSTKKEFDVARPVAASTDTPSAF